MATPTAPPAKKPPPLTPAAEAAARKAKTDPGRELKDGRDVTTTVPRWDRYLASQEASEGGTYDQALKTHGRSPAWAAYARETFSKLYDSGLSKELPHEERPMGSDWVAKLHEAAEALPEWRALQSRAKRDAWACGVAAGEALNVIAQTVTPPETDPQQLQDELDFVRSLSEGGKTHPKHLQRMSNLQRQIRDAQDEHARASQMLATKGAAMRSAMRKAAMVANDTIEEMDAAMGVLGAGDGGGIMSRVNAPPQAIRTVMKNSAKLRRVLKLAGRMKSHAIAKQRTKARPGQEELCDVKLGSNLDRLLPSELVNLATPDTEALLYRKLMESAATVYELRGREHRSEGPLILAVDESGSMQGQRDEWAKSVAFALMEIAARQNRPFAYVHFTDGVTRVDLVEDPKTFTLKQIEELVTFFSNGGTRIGAALDHCATMLETRKVNSPWKRADVILVTDGCSGDYADQMSAITRIKAIGGHLYTVLIEDQSSDPCVTEADEAVHLTSEAIRKGDPGKLGGIFSI